MEILKKKGSEVDYNDPHIPEAPRRRKYKLERGSVPLTRENLRSYDCVIVATDHSAYDPEFIVEHSELVIDTRNLIGDSNNHNGKVVKA